MAVPSLAIPASTPLCSSSKRDSNFILPRREGISEASCSWRSTKFANAKARPLFKYKPSTARIKSFQNGDSESYETATFWDNRKRQDETVDDVLGSLESKNTATGNSFLGKLMVLLGIAVVITLLSIGLRLYNQSSLIGIQFQADSSSSSSLATNADGFTFKAFGSKVVLPEYAPGYLTILPHIVEFHCFHILCFVLFPRMCQGNSLIFFFFIMTLFQQHEILLISCLGENVGNLLITYHPRFPGFRWVYFWLLMAAGCGLFISEEALNIWVGITLSRMLTLGSWQSFIDSFSRNAPYIVSTVLWVYWGVCISDMVPFYLGKLFRQSGASDDVCSKLGIDRDKAMSITRVVQRYGNLVGFVERFSLGVRNPTAFLAGAMDISPEYFFAGVCCGGLITLPVQLGIGFLMRERPVFALATVATAVGIWTVFPYAAAASTALFLYLRHRYSS